ncbi:MAG: hypothetical protein JSW27_04575 [Phycisphaerales bacterium]|nr:MAG: hypothetical protein JSW27_04575 [Phycisphaerales bacterium]
MEHGHTARRLSLGSVIAATVLVAFAGLVLAATDPDELTERPKVKLVPVEVNLPTAQFVGTPKDIRAPCVKPVQTKPGPPFLAPEGTKNVALGKPVSSSDPEPVIGELVMVTDGDKEAGEGSFVELGPLRQHVTIDLQAEHVIYGIRVWHYHQEPRVYFDVVIQVSNDPNFATGVKTIFNNDMDNSSGLGAGKDMHYVDTHFGELVDAQALRGRYVRLYSRGSTANDLNHYIEVEVYGKPSTEVPALVPIRTELPEPVAPDTLSYRFSTSDSNGTRAEPRADADSDKPGLVPLNIQYPRQEFTYCFGRWTHVPHREDIPTRPPAALMVPEATRNVALGKPVSSSYPRLIIGTLDKITDGDKKGREASCAELGPGVQHITIDLQEVCEIHAVAVWHFHGIPHVYFDVIVQLSETPIMPGTRGIVYNSDLDNSTGLGVGRDRRYVETHVGKVITVDGKRGRYVRLYSNGNSMNELNRYLEVEVYGRPVD